MKKILLVTSIAVALTAGAAGVASAHHSFAAEFDANAPVTLRGTITKMEWINPHSWIHIDVKTPDGKVEKWMVEGGAPNALLRRGWDRNSLPAGTKIKVQGFQAKDGSFRANGRDTEWMVEGGTPNTLFRRGFTRDAVKAGMEITVEGYRAKNGANRANGRDLILKDGRRLFMGSSGTGAPIDGKDASEAK
jgi:hypothetical protein